MFRLYELYSLHSKKMASYGTSPTWCLCEKLPRSILHIAPAPEQWCDVCGRRRRPRACLSSSSDEEARVAERQKMLAERRRAEELRQGSVRVKVAMSAKKPKPKPNLKTRGKTGCLKCGGEQKYQKQQQQQQTKSGGIPTATNNNKIYSGRFGHYRKPQPVQSRLRSVPTEGGAKKRIDNDKELKAPPPPPPSPPASPPAPSVKINESLWEQPSEDMPNLVAFAHEVFNRPLHLRKRQLSFYDNLFVSDFIPLDKPITDAAGGAISKRRRLFGRPLRSHCSRPLPPLSQVLTEMLTKQKVRAKGGGLPSKVEETSCSDAATQFSPFDIYEGPSEDALVVDSARLMLRQPNALHIKQRADLPPTRLSSFESEPSSDCSSSSPFEMPTAPPAVRPRNSYNSGAPFRLQEVMKAVAHSGLSDTSASSSSTSSSSHKSVSSTLPVHPQSVRSRGGEDPPYIEKKAADLEFLPISMIEKILWLLEQKNETDESEAVPLTAEALKLMEKTQEEPTDPEQRESFKGLMQFMKSLQITDPDPQTSAGDNAEDCLGILKSDEDMKLFEASVPEVQPQNDMSNESPLNSSNKSDDAKYEKVLSNPSHKAKQATRKRGDPAPRKVSRPSRSSSMWSMLSGFFTAKTKGSEESKPLKTTPSSHYGAINEKLPKPPAKQIPPVGTPKRNSSNQSCHKCGLSCRKKVEQKPNNSPGTNKPKCKLHPSPKGNMPPSSVKEAKLTAKRDSAGKLHACVSSKRSQDISKDHCTKSASPPPTPPSISSTHFESCIGFTTPASSVETMKLQRGPELRHHLLNQLLEKLRADEAKRQPLVYHAIKTLSTVQYSSSEIIEPKMLASISPRLEQMQQFTLNSALAYEFRTPDIETVELAQQAHHSEPESLGAASTPIAHSETSPSSHNSYKEELSPKKKHSYQPVWPAHPVKLRKHHIKFQARQVEVKSTDQKEPKEELQPKIRKRNKNEKWIVNENVQQKIAEMMSKPIKLLSGNEAIAAQS